MLVHLNLFHSYHVLFAVHTAEFCFKVLLDFPDLAADQYLVLKELGDVDTNLFEDKDDDQVRCEGGHVTDPVGNDVIRDVSIDELEHVPLADQRVLPRVLESMIFSINEPIDNNLVKYAVNCDESDVNYGWGELEVIRNFIAILFNILIVPQLHANLCANNQAYEKERNGNALENLSIVGIESGDFVCHFCLLVDVVGCFEVFTFLGRVLEVTHKPHVSDFVLFPLPALDE